MRNRHSTQAWPALSALAALLCLAAGPASAGPVSGAGGWQSGETISRQDGTRAYEAVLLSSPARAGGALIVRCAQGELSVLVRWPPVLTLDVQEPQLLTWRFDDGPQQAESWMTLTSSSASVTPSPRAFLAAMRGAHRLDVNTRDFGDGHLIALRFDLDGGGNAPYRPAGARQVAGRAIEACP
jgi:hypothetical protein